MYGTLFKQLHRSPTPAALCAQLMAQPRPKNNAAIASALEALNEAIRRNRRGRVLSAARMLNKRPLNKKARIVITRLRLSLYTYF